MRKYRVLTLYYHRVNDIEMDYNLLCVTPCVFRQQMLYLKHNYPIVRFEDDWSRLDSDAVAITFDDGYRDNLIYALPILEELEIPATIFVSTGTMDQGRELWWDELERVLLRGSDFPTLFRLEDETFPCQWDTSTYGHRKNCYVGLHYLMKNFAGLSKREKWLEQLWEWRGMNRIVDKGNLTVSADDCRKLANSDMISLGGHTISHPSLACLSKEEQEVEIRDSLEALEEAAGKKITLFSYPFGIPQGDFNEETEEICRKYGIKKAATTEDALWNPATDLYRIPRKVVRDWGAGEFESKIKEYWME